MGRICGRARAGGAGAGGLVVAPFGGSPSSFLEAIDPGSYRISVTNRKLRPARTRMPRRRLHDRGDGRDRGRLRGHRGRRIGDRRDRQRGENRVRLGRGRRWRMPRPREERDDGEEEHRADDHDGVGCANCALWFAGVEHGIVSCTRSAAPLRRRRPLPPARRGLRRLPARLPRDVARGPAGRTRAVGFGELAARGHRLLRRARPLRRRSRRGLRPRARPVPVRERSRGLEGVQLSVGPARGVPGRLRRGGARGRRAERRRRRGARRVALPSARARRAGGAPRRCGDAGRVSGPEPAVHRRRRPELRVCGRPGARGRVVPSRLRRANVDRPR